MDGPGAPWGALIHTRLRSGGGRTGTPLPRSASGTRPESTPWVAAVVAGRTRHASLPDGRRPDANRPTNVRATRRARRPQTGSNGRTPAGRKPEPARNLSGSQLPVTDLVSTAPLQTWSNPGSLSRCVPDLCGEGREGRSCGAWKPVRPVSGCRPKGSGHPTHQPPSQPALSLSLSCRPCAHACC
jgi:hypothetical protein